MRRIEVHEHNDQWSARYGEEAGKLSVIFGDDLVALHHIGSTAVPGLMAKPTIDILCIVREGTPISAYYAQMESMGYEARGECLDATIPGTPGRFYFPKIVDHQHVVHVHVCHNGHPQIRELLALRDYLRAKPQRAREYGKFKKQLADSVHHDNVSYMRGKDAMIKELIVQALEWSAQQDGAAVTDSRRH